MITISIITCAKPYRSTVSESMPIKRKGPTSKEDNLRWRKTKEKLGI